MAQVADDHDLSALHLHDRHSGLGITNDDLVAMYRTILLARLLDQKIWGLNRMGKAAFVVSGQGHEGAQVGSAWAIRKGHDVVLPYYRDLAVVLTQLRRAADAQPLGEQATRHHLRVVAHRNPHPPRGRHRPRRQAQG